MSLSITAGDKQLCQAPCPPVSAGAVGVMGWALSDSQEMSNLFMAGQKYSGSLCSALINHRKREKTVLDSVLCCEFHMSGNIKSDYSFLEETSEFKGIHPINFLYWNINANIPVKFPGTK